MNNVEHKFLLFIFFIYSNFTFGQRDINYQFPIDGEMLLVSAKVIGSKPPFNFPLERTVQLMENGIVVDELLFNSSISTIWRLSPYNFKVLVGTQKLVSIEVDGNRVKNVGEVIFNPFDKPSYGTDVSKSLIIKDGSLVVYYDDFKWNRDYKLYITNGKRQISFGIGMKYQFWNDGPSFVYPPHRTIQIRDDFLYVLDELDKKVYRISTDLLEVNEYSILSDFDVFWSYIDFELVILLVDEQVKKDKILVSNVIFDKSNL